MPDRPKQDRANSANFALDVDPIMRGTVASEIVAGLSAGDVVLVADAEIGTRVRVDLQDRLATGGE